MKQLTTAQKRTLGKLAREAWDGLSEAARSEAIEAALDAGCTTKTAIIDHWRKVQQESVTGMASMTGMTNRDFTRMQMHWLLLKDSQGNRNPDAAPSARTMYAMARAQEEPLRVAHHKLAEALREQELPAAYAEKICQTQYRCSLADASEKQVWRLFYTVRNRRHVSRARPAPTVDPLRPDPRTMTRPTDPAPALRSMRKHFGATAQSRGCLQPTTTTDPF